MNLQSVRGTRDLKGNELKTFQHVVEVARSISNNYGFEEIETPIFEFTDVFKRTLGDASDIVNKEMYTFEDKSGDWLTLRPEGTASICRSVIEHQLFRELPLKYFYQGPMFRHERPQKGRYRQFYQIGVELIGIASPIADAEVISMGWEILKSLGLKDKCILEINSLGDNESRQSYRQQLITYFNKYKKDLSADSQVRLEKNPLRILDSKDDADKKIAAGAPKMHDCFNPSSQEFYQKLLGYLSDLQIPYKQNEQLVRGLDYYGHTVFEFTTDQLGAQNALLSGGRYDGLISTMGGPETQGVGWGAGVDRLSLLTSFASHQALTIGLIPFSDSDEGECLKLMETLRRNALRAVMPYSGNLSKRMKKLGRDNCSYAVIVGGDEEKQGLVQIKNLTNGEQFKKEKTKVLEYFLAEVKK